MFSNFGARWNTLTRYQQIAVVVVAALLIYFLAINVGGGGGLFSTGRIFALVAILLFALPIHEFAHAAAAVALGDPTPIRQGRYTLNPLAHLDPMGAILIALVGFGWAKPVQWNPRNVNIDLRLASIIIAAAGPLSNLLLALLGVVILRFTPLDALLVNQFLIFFVQINVLLFVFNLIPIPPLDGSHILFALLPGNTYQLRVMLSQYGFMLLFAVMFLMPGLIRVPAQWVLGFLTTITNF
jgi:Zn-dependent protease